MTEPSPAPMTRREIRMAERAAAAAQSTPSTVTAAALPSQATESSVVPSASPTSRPPSLVSPPLTRRELREAERAACTPPFVPTVTTTAPPTADDDAPVVPNAFTRLSATSVAKSGIVLALSGALLITAFGGQVTQGSTGFDGAALRAASDRQAALAERAETAARTRADAASTTRLSSAAAAYAAGQRAEAVRTALTALETADEVKVEARALVASTKLKPLGTAAAQLEKLLEKVEEPDPALVAAAQQVERTTGDAARATTPATPKPAGTKPSGTKPPSAASEQAAPSAADATAMLRAQAPASRSARGPLPAATEAPPTLEQLVAQTDPEVLAAMAASDLETTEALTAAAARLRGLAKEIEQDAAVELARKEAREAAAHELSRKVAAVIDSPNGHISTDLLCAPDFAPDALLRCDAAKALERLNRAYRADHGRDLRIVSSYRSYAAQIATKASRGALAARPGTSNHGRGIAVDFDGFGSVGQFGDPDYLWMKRHAAEFNWHHPAIMEPGGGGPQEPWHWEYGTA